MGVPYASAQESGNVREQLQQMDARLRAAEARADASEARMKQMEQEMRASPVKLRNEERAKKMKGDAVAEADYQAGDPKDSKNYKGVLPVIEDNPFATLDLN